MLCGPGHRSGGSRSPSGSKEVAEAIGRGWGNAEIARRLYLGLPTVKAHVSRLLTKLDVANRTQVALLVHDARRPDHD